MALGSETTGDGVDHALHQAGVEEAFPHPERIVFLFSDLFNAQWDTHQTDITRWMLCKTNGDGVSFIQALPWALTESNLPEVDSAFYCLWDEMIKDFDLSYYKLVCDVAEDGAGDVREGVPSCAAIRAVADDYCFLCSSEDRSCRSWRCSSASSGLSLAETGSETHGQDLFGHLKSFWDLSPEKETFCLMRLMMHALYLELMIVAWDAFGEDGETGESCKDLLDKITQYVAWCRNKLHCRDGSHFHAKSFT
jgi:hypothetical protein